MGKEQLLWQEQAQAKSVSKGKISLFYIFDVFQAHSGLLAYLPIIVVTICIFGGLSWQVFLPITDPARYQCYALTFWLGSSALALLPAGQCSFLSLTTSQPAFHLLPLEYPPLTLVLFSLALFAPLPYYQFAFALWMALVAALIYWLLRRYGPRNSAPVFALYLFLGAIPTAQQRFDLLPAALTLICIIAAERKHWNIAYIALAFGTLLKLYPALLLPALFIAEQQTKKLTPQGTAQGTHKGQDRSNKGSAGHPQGMPLQWYEAACDERSYHCRGIPCGCPAALWFFGLVLGITGFFALLDFQGAVVSQLSYFLHRPIQVEALGSTFLWLGNDFGFPIKIIYSFGSTNIISALERTVSLICSLLLIAGITFTLFMQWRGKLDLTQASIALLLVFIATGKVFSPQYLIWLMPLLAYAGAFDLIWLLAWGSISALTTYIFIFYYSRPVNDPTLIPYAPNFAQMVAIRNACFVLLTLAYLCNWLQVRQRKLLPTALKEEVSLLK